MRQIGFLAYGRPPRSILPAGRIRALIAEAALQGARLLFFSSLDCDGTRASIDAETWSPDGFVRGDVGPPDVVITVNLPLRPEEAETVAWLMARVPVISDPGPNKLDMARELMATAVARYVIPFQELRGDDPRASLLAWVGEHGPSVIKTAEGKRGSGLHFLDRGDADDWIVRHDTTRYRGALPQAVDYLHRRIAGRGRYRRYLVQRFIRSRSQDGRAVDLRVHVQRDGTGAWAVTRGYVRLGEYGLPMSNISRGGYQGELIPFLTHRGGRSAIDVEAELHALALEVAAAVEQTGGRRLSELGVDVAIDPEDRLWLIEANTYPGTSLHEHDRAVRTIAYACHVADTKGAGA